MRSFYTGAWVPGQYGVRGNLDPDDDKPLSEGARMSWIVDHWDHLGTVAGKAVLMYATAVVGLRLGERRTLVQWTIIDFATAVAVGAIVGRTAIADTQSYATGAVALLTLIAVHRLASLLRFRPLVGKLFDHRIRVLVDHGQLRRRQLRLCGLTDNDLYAQLRQRGVFDLAQLRYVLYEAKGDLTLVPDPDAAKPEPPLVRAGLDSADGYPGKEVGHRSATQ
jgi:uncharacterized membrane protein YcaP (DUF421 family)